MKVKDFLGLTEESEILKLKAVKESINGRSFIGDRKCRQLTDQAYYKVQLVRKYYNNGQIPYLVSMLLGIGERELMKSDYVPLIYFIKWVEEELEKISKLEEFLNKPDEDEFQNNAVLEAAGISEMNKFEEINIIDELAEGKIWKWEEIQRYSYKTIYTKLLKNKTMARVQRRKRELETKKT